MDQQQQYGYQYYGIYPASSQYYPNVMLPEYHGGCPFVPFVPLTSDMYMYQRSYFAMQAIPNPSTKEVKEILGDKLNELTRKDKRKLIKNKKSRMKRKLIAEFRKETENSLVNNFIENPSADEVAAEDEHNKQARRWEERRKMVEEDRYSRMLLDRKNLQMQEKIVKERNYLYSIAREVEKRKNPQLFHSTIVSKAEKEVSKPVLPDYCISYLRTGCCRFGKSCTHPHIAPKRSRGVLIHNMFMIPGLEDSDDSLSSYLERSDEEAKQRFIDFYYDLIPELEKFGPLRYVMVAANRVPHLRGNVYVVWENRESGGRGLAGLQDRYYAGQKLYVEYLPESVMSWNNGLCDEYRNQSCSRGDRCSFLHFLINPDNRYMIPDMEQSNKDKSHSRSRSPSRRKHHLHSSHHHDRESSQGSKKSHRSRSRSRRR